MLVGFKIVLSFEILLLEYPLKLNKSSVDLRRKRRRRRRRRKRERERKRKAVNNTITSGLSFKFCSRSQLSSQLKLPQAS